MNNENLKKLIALHNETTSKFQSGKCPDIVIDEFNNFSNLIKEFFVGKEEQIKNIYNIIRNNSLPYNRIKIVDVNMARHLYNEYLEGLKEYADKYTSLREGDNIDKEAISNMTNRVSERDTEFIDSIFGGEKNPEAEADIDTAIKNVETLIDIDGDFSKFISISNEICNKVISANTGSYTDAIDEGLKVFFKSISYYNFKCIKEIFETFEKIEESIQTRTPAIDKEVPQYQIF